MKYCNNCFYPDIKPDLYRTLINKFSINSSKLFKEKFDHFFLKHINEFQKVLDKNKSPSEVHIVLKK